jgi:trigger factor
MARPSAPPSHGHEHPGLSIEVSRTGPCAAKVRMRVTDDEFRRSRLAGLKNVAQRTQLKGFRPGKVPPQMVEKHFGTEVDREVIQHFLQDAFDRAIAEGGFRPAASPRVDLETLARHEGEDFEHEFQILLRPEFELGEVEGLEVESQPVGVSDEELDMALGEIRRDLSHPEPAGDEGLPADGVAVCRVDFLWNADEPILSREGIRLSPKTPLRGLDPAEFEASMSGIRPGDRREFPFTFPPDFPHEAARGATGTARLTIDQAWRILPPSAAELLERFGAADEAALRETVRARILERKNELEERRIESALIERLIQAHPMDLPEPLVEDQARAKVAELRAALEGQGVPVAEMEKRLEEEHARSREAASRALRAIYLFEEIAKKKDLLVTAKDIEAELDAIAVRNQVGRDEVRKYYREKGLLQELALELLERKVRSWLRERADIKLAPAAD